VNAEQRESQFGDRFQMGSPALWLFAYGSLIFRPDFSAEETVVAVLANHGRRFWQGSPDHRGTPEAPGRVVTLVSAPGERCLGLAYRLAPAMAEQILGMLDERERAGFERVEVELAAEPLRTLTAVTYVARRDNPHFLGPAPLEALAAEITLRHGPSGSNVEYVRRLARALRELGAADDHVFEVERRVEALAGVAHGPPDSTT
jgi:glutathione-specific gamma-glutamylcyclotransferase